jgi:F0F1-type ATP synthase membrane subunit b/b'
MSTGVVIVIVIGALIVLALLAWLGTRARHQRLDSRRQQARQIRREAEVHDAQADRVSAEAEERAARARQEEAGAREQSARADEHRREAETRHERADDVDPDGRREAEQRPRAER